MTDTSPDHGDTFDRLLSAMPRIAEAVNAFASEENQRAALEALVRALGVPPVMQAVSAQAPAPAPKPYHDVNGSAEMTSGADEASAEEGSGPDATAKASGQRRRVVRKAEPVRDLDFRPEGIRAFKDLVEEKKPASIDQKNVLAVFWLEQIAGIEGIGVGHVMAAYRDRNWREPADPINALQATASRQSWIDTKNMKAIVTTAGGRNLVKHDMPTAKAGK